MDDVRQKIARHYRSSVEAYRRYWAPVLNGFARPLFERLGQLDRGDPATGARGLSSATIRRALDIGCGVGPPEDVLRSIVGPHSQIIAGDMTLEMLRAARQSDPSADLVAMDATRLPFVGRSFGLVTSTFVLHHVREQHRALAEAYRVLELEGIIGVATWGERDEGNAAFRVFEETLAEFGAPEADPLDLPVWTDYVSDPARLRSLLESAGFSDVETWTGSPGYQWTAETLSGYRTGLGATARRLASLSRPRQAAFRKSLSGKLAALRPEDFAWAPVIVFGVGLRPRNARPGQGADRAD